MSNHQMQNNNKTNPAMLLTEKQAAELLNLTPRALQGWRVQGKGPVFYKISGRAIRYSLADIERWLADQLRRSTSDPGPSGSGYAPATEAPNAPFEAISPDDILMTSAKQAKGATKKRKR